MVVNERIFSLETRGVETVKELKEQIRKLREELVTLDKTSDEYEKNLRELTNAEETLERVMGSNRRQTIAATGSYNALVEEMSALKRIWREVNTEAERTRIGKRIAEINAELKTMDESIGNHQRKVGSYEEAIRKAFMTPQQEIKKLRVELAGLTEGSEEYNRVFIRMADLTTKVQKQQEALRFASADLGNILGNLAGVAGSVVGGFSAINAAMGLMFGNDSPVQEAMLKVQQFMAIVQGLGALENIGDRISGLFAGIQEFVRSFRGGTAAVVEFDKSLKEAEGTTEKVTTEISSQAGAFASNTAAANNNATANRTLKESYDELWYSLNTINQEYGREVRAVKESTASDEEKIKQIDRLKQKRNEQRLAANEAFEAETKMKAIEAATVLQEKKVEVQTIKTNNVIKLLGQSFKGTGTASKTAAGGMVVYTAATKAAEVATQALKVALMSLGIGLIIAAFTSLLGVLGKGITSIWNWATGVTKAKTEVEALKKAQEELNLVLEDRNEKLDFETRLMEAQGKDYDDIYNYKKQETTATLNLVKAQLAEAEAQAAQMEGKRRFKKQLEELNPVIEDYRNQVKNLEKALRGYDQDREIHLAQEANKPRGGGSNYDSQLKAAQNLYKQLQDLYKTDRQKLAETYEINKKTIEKYIKNKSERNRALLLLDRKYYDDLKKLTRDSMDAIYGIYMGHESRRLALLNVWNKNYLDEAKKVLDEEEKIALRGAAKRVGFEKKSEADIAKMDKASKDEYLKRQTLYNNERFLIEREFAQKYDKLVAEQRVRDIEEGRRVIEIKKLQAKTDEEVLATEIELAEYDLAHVYQKEGESALQYQVRVNKLAKALEELLKRQQEVAANKDWTQLRLDNDATASKIANGENSMQYYDAQIKAAQYYYDNLKQLQTESNEEFRQRQLEALDNLTQLEKEKLQQRFDNWSNLANGIGDIFGSIADMYQTDIEAQKDADGQYNAESRRKFEQVKALQIAQATIQTISGAIAAYMGCQSLGQPWGTILGAVQAAAVTAAGMAQIAQIKKTKLDGSSSTASSTKYAVATPSITDYNPQGTANLTGSQETENLANALAKNPIKAYCVESEVTAKQELAQQRTSESTF